MWRTRAVDRFGFACCTKFLEWQAERFSSIRKLPGEEADPKGKNNSYLKSLICYEDRRYFRGWLSLVSNSWYHELPNCQNTHTHIQNLSQFLSAFNLITQLIKLSIIFNFNLNR